MANATRLLIKNGTLIDGSGGDPVLNRLLIVEGNRIGLVGETDGSMRAETPDDTVIDAAGKFILPGLIDAHCHISLHQGALPGIKYTSTAEFCSLWAAYAIGRVLRAGVTSIAVPGGKWFTDVTVREAVEGGLLEGPRMVVAGRALSNYGGIFDPDPYPAFEGTPADTAGVLCNTRDEFSLGARRRTFGFGLLPIPLLERRLQRTQFIPIHRVLIRPLRRWATSNAAALARDFSLRDLRRDQPGIERVALKVLRAGDTHAPGF